MLILVAGMLLACTDGPDRISRPLEPRASATKWFTDFGASFGSSSITIGPRSVSIVTW